MEVIIILKSIFRFSILLIIFISTIFLTCSKDTTGPTDEEKGVLINPNDGGVVYSQDSLLTITIPPGSLLNDTYIDISLLNNSEYPTNISNLDLLESQAIE